MLSNEVDPKILMNMNGRLRKNITDSYYKRELGRLEMKKDEIITVRFTDSDGESTKYLSLTPESIPDIIEYLVKLNKVLNGELC